MRSRDKTEDKCVSCGTKYREKKVDKKEPILDQIVEENEESEENKDKEDEHEVFLKEFGRLNGRISAFIAKNDGEDSV